MVVLRGWVALAWLCGRGPVVLPAGPFKDSALARVWGFEVGLGERVP